MYSRIAFSVGGPPCGIFAIIVGSLTKSDEETLVGIKRDDPRVKIDHEPHTDKTLRHDETLNPDAENDNNL